MIAPSPPVSLAEYVRSRFVWWLLLSGVITLLLLQHSFSVGNLSHEVSYDDIGYFNDGLRRLDVVYAGGLRGALSDYRADPPHAPYSSLLAMGSFAIFGVHDWAPYAGSGVLLLCAIAAVDCLLRDISPRLRALCLVLLCTTPLALKGVTEFRPDIACGLFTALGVVLVLRDGFSDCGWPRRAAIALLFGLALLAKPTAFPFTLGMFGVAVLLAGLRDAIVRRGLARFWGWVYRSSLCGSLAVAVALPHYLFAWRHVTLYIYTVLFGEHAAELTLTRGEPLPLWFHLTGGGGAQMLGWHLYLFAAAFALGLGVVLWQRQWASVMRFLALALAGVVAFVVPTRTGVSNPFFAATLQWLIVLGGLEAVRVVCLGEPTRSRLAWRPILAWSSTLALALVGLYAVLPIRGYGGSRGNQQAAQLRQVVREVLADLREESPKPGPVKIFVPMQPGGCSLNADILAWHARKEGLPLAMKSSGLSTNLEEYRREMERVEFVLACTPTNPETATGLDIFPAGKLAPKVLELARGQQGLTEVAHYQAPGPLTFHLFKRGPSLTRRSEDPPR